jgi:hypothetical protein
MERVEDFVLAFSAISGTPTGPSSPHSSPSSGTYTVARNIMLENFLYYLGGLPERSKTKIDREGSGLAL